MKHSSTLGLAYGKWAFSQFIVVVTTLALGACSQAPLRYTAVAKGQVEAVAQQMQAYIDAQMKEHRITGLSVALVQDQRVWWALGRGWADQEAHIPASAQTVYRMGSISKVLTSTLAMQSVQQGHLKLDDSLASYVPLPAAELTTKPAAVWPAITARQLMSHHAGLQRDLLKGMWGEQVEDFRTMVARLSADERAYPPNLVFAYSNLGMTVLGAVLERVEQKPFEVLMQQQILTPLGMQSASFTAALPQDAGTARPYAKGQRVPELALRDIPAGGLNASVLDMCQFIKMVFAQGRAESEHGAQLILRPEALQAMLTPQNLAVPLDFDIRVGLGWMLSLPGQPVFQKAGPLVQHNGATINFRSQMMLLPEQKLGVIVATNSRVPEQVLQEIATRALALSLQAQTGQEPFAAGAATEAAVPTSTQAPYALTLDDLQSYVGYYATSFGRVQITRKGSQLEAQLGSQRLQLVPDSDGRFKLRYSWLGLIPVPLGVLDQVRIDKRQVAGREVLVARLAGHESLLGEKMRPPVMAPTLQAAIAGRLGHYVPQWDAASAAEQFLRAVDLEADAGGWLARIQSDEKGAELAEVPIVFSSDTEARMVGPLADAGPLIRWRAPATSAVDSAAVPILPAQWSAFSSGVELRRRVH